MLCTDDEGGFFDWGFYMLYENWYSFALYSRIFLQTVKGKSDDSAQQRAWRGAFSTLLSYQSRIVPNYNFLPMIRRRL